MENTSRSTTLTDQMAATVLERIARFQTVKNISNDRLTKEAGLNNMKRKQDGKVAMTTGDIDKLCSTYHLRREWLTGAQGAMFDEEGMAAEWEYMSIIAGEELPHAEPATAAPSAALTAERIKNLEQQVADLRSQNTFLQGVVDRLLCK